MRAIAKLVSVYAGGKRVACHPRSRNKGRQTTLTEVHAFGPPVDGRVVERTLRAMGG